MGLLVSKSSPREINENKILNNCTVKDITDYESIHLPEEILIRIISFLDLRTLFTVSRVCRTWRRLGEDPVLWKQICKKYLSPSEHPPSNGFIFHFQEFTIKIKIFIFKN